MEGRSKRRCLRNNSNCVPMDNIFKSSNSIINSPCNSIPPQILSKLKKFPTLTCQDINSLTFVNNESHLNAIDRMNEAIQLQKRLISIETPTQNKNIEKFSHNAYGVSMMDQKQGNSIKNQPHQHQYHSQFIENYDRGHAYQKHNHYNQYGEEILYNQFFRNDLENLFLQ